jgi:hypothetical protein
MWILALVMTVAALAGAAWSAVDVLRGLPRSNRDWVWY